MDRTKLVAIDTAKPDDLDAIVTLLGDLNLPPDGIANHLATALVARHDDNLVGCAAVELYGAAGLLRSVAVRLDFRSLGLGEQLVRSCLDMARSEGVQNVYLLTETAAGYFPRFGFQEVPRQDVDPAVRQSVEFTTACPDDAQAMVLQLTHP